MSAWVAAKIAPAQEGLKELHRSLSLSLSLVGCLLPLYTFVPFTPNMEEAQLWQRDVWVIYIQRIQKGNFYKDLPQTLKYTNTK